MGGAPIREISGKLSLQKGISTTSGNVSSSLDKIWKNMTAREM